MAHIVVLGAGLGGTLMAYEMKDQLRPGDTLTVVTKDPKYHFVPSNPWVAVGWRTPDDIEVDLAPVFAKKGIAFKPVAATGIRRVLAADIAQADALGYYIRLIGMAQTEIDADGSRRLFQRVHPHLVHRDHPLAHVDGATNAVVAEGNFVGRLLFQGAGAGDGPTASAVVADLIDIARGDIGALWVEHRVVVGEGHLLQDALGAVLVESSPSTVPALESHHPPDGSVAAFIPTVGVVQLTSATSVEPPPELADFGSKGMIRAAVSTAGALPKRVLPILAAKAFSSAV